MLTVALYGSRRQEAGVDKINELLTTLSKRGCSLLFHSKLYSHLTSLISEEKRSQWNIQGVTDSTNFSADMAVSIGGDGTFLRTARWIGDKEIPILGINTGHLGYLTAFDISETEMIADILFSGDFSVENRTLLKFEADYIPQGVWKFALNEIAIVKNDSTSMINVLTRLDGNELASYLADGLIIATPTGSTGYNLSVGGPVVQPTSPNFVISPIAAHSLTMRPVVVNDSSVIEMTVEARSSNFRLSLDGNSFSLPCSTRMKVCKASFTVRVIQRPGFNFAVRLREKLLWGVRT